MPNYLSAITYDATLMAAAAKKAGTFNKTAIDKAIGSIDFTGGICQKNYQSDGRHTLVHTNETRSSSPTNVDQGGDLHDPHAGQALRHRRHNVVRTVRPSLRETTVSPAPS